MSRVNVEKYMNILEILDNEDYLNEEKQQYYTSIMHAIFDNIPVEYYE